MPSDVASSPRLLRRINASALLRFALDSGDFTAAEAMEETGLTRATVLGLCDELAAAGWLEELVEPRGSARASRGRPARRHRVRADAGVVVGIDAGEHRFVASVATLRGEVLATLEVRRAQGSIEGPEERIATIRGLVRDALGHAGADESASLLTVVGVPAPVDEDGRSPDGQGVFWPLMNPELRTELGGLVVIENDANLAARAEHAQHPLDDVATLLAGERFGAGLFVDGNLLSGHGGGAGEMRFLDILVPDGIDTGGADGLGALARFWARQALEDAASVPGRPSVLSSLAPDDLTASAVIAAGEGGDPLAERVLDRLGDRLAAVAAVFSSILACERIVVAGLPPEDLGPILARARSVLERDFFPPFPELRICELGKDVIVRGAVASALRRLREDPLAVTPRSRSGADHGG